MTNSEAVPPLPQGARPSSRPDLTQDQIVLIAMGMLHRTLKTLGGVGMIREDQLPQTIAWKADRIVDEQGRECIVLQAIDAAPQVTSSLVRAPASALDQLKGSTMFKRPNGHG